MLQTSIYVGGGPEPDPGIYLAIAECYIELREDQNAVDYFTECLSLKSLDRSDKSHVHLRRGDIYGRLGEIEKAVEEYDEAIKIDPNHIHFFNRSLLNARLGNYQQALEDQEKYLDECPDLEGWDYVQRARIYQKLGDCENAKADCETALAFNEEQEAVHFTIAQIYMDCEEYQLAVEQYTEVINLIPLPDGASHYGQRGWAYLKLKKYDDAVQNFGIAIGTLAYDPAACYLGRGMAYRALGQSLEAIEDLTTAIEENVFDLTDDLQLEDAYKERGASASRLN